MSERRDTGREIFREAKVDSVWSTKLHMWKTPHLDDRLQLLSPTTWLNTSRWVRIQIFSCQYYFWEMNTFSNCCEGGIQTSKTLKITYRVPQEYSNNGIRSWSESTEYSQVNEIIILKMDIHENPGENGNRGSFYVSLL